MYAVVIIVYMIINIPQIKWKDIFQIFKPVRFLFGCKKTCIIQTDNMTDFQIGRNT